jgi:acyl-CoA synthetase (NDP forming)
MDDTTIVQEMTGCTREEAEKALIEHNTIVDAIDALTPSNPVTSGSKYIPKKPVVSSGMDEEQAKRLFSSFGIAAVSETIVTTPQQAQTAIAALGERVVLKILSSEILHKSEMGGVAVNVSIDTISNRFLQMIQDVKDKAGITAERFLVQEMVSGGIEIILGMHRDVLGVSILLGMGGVTAELLQDTSLRLMPSQGGLSAETAREMAMSLKTWPLLDGYRGRPKADVDALVSAIVDFSTMVAALGDRLLEAEINPLFVLEQGQGVKAADGIVVLGDA